MTCLDKNSDLFFLRESSDSETRETKEKECTRIVFFLYGDLYIYITFRGIHRRRMQTPVRKFLDLSFTIYRKRELLWEIFARKTRL